MNKGSLSEYFEGVAAKHLSAVEAYPETSNQHEFNGVTALRNLFGADRFTTKTDFIYLGDDISTTERSEGFLTWYDARDKHPTRTEYRLYFSSNTVTDLASEDDLILFCKQHSGDLLVMVAKAGSTAENQLLWLFDLPFLGDKTLFKEVGDSKVGFVERTILEHLGIESIDTDDQYLELMLERYKGSFPKTRVFSMLARETCEKVDPVEAPDATLIQWLDHEEKLFRSLERHIVEQRLKNGFDDVESFISFSLSVHNRRKSRAGHSLENHLEQIFVDNKLLFERGVKTENRSKPDFLFPGQRAYHTDDFPRMLLTMLGVKTSCKDRWRQVLAEANKIPQKHLLTLEPGISNNQTEEMQSQSLQLVVPDIIFSSYGAEQKAWLLNVQDFILCVKEKQIEYF
ncbi:type II restriction endonuclease [uncultured Desulfuromusa sp.]|uniref:type II restriction endonuclease n=1 Tax=uncultured Desulfuromusa sp. TaxID=219183 RepID=UPI002AA7F2D7|nr:type II restriction endonuclease [uncultured Desulfuromusa sp.]